MSGYSENEDDPPVYESSGEEWDEAEELERKRNRRRTSQRLSKKPRITHVETSDSDSDDEYEERSLNGLNKKMKKSPIKTSPVTSKSPTPTLTPSALKPSTPTTQTTFTTGTFVISKKDAQEGSASNPPCIWKIDGKALLQKYEPFEEDGKIRHRNTSIYTGWSSLDKDEYASVQVQVYVHSGQKMIVEMNWDQLKTIEIDDSE